MLHSMGREINETEAGFLHTAAFESLPLALLLGEFWGRKNMMDLSVKHYSNFVKGIKRYKIKSI